MKNMIFVTLIAVSITGIRAQEPKKTVVPETVKQAFAKKFPAAEKVKWSMESATEYEAEFKSKGAESAANFDQNGKWLVTETEINSSQLPEAVQAVLKKDFIDYKVEEIEKAETAAGELFYEVGLEKGEAELEIKFTPDGKVVKKEEKKEDKE